MSDNRTNYSCKITRALHLFTFIDNKNTVLPFTIFICTKVTAWNIDTCHCQSCNLFIETHIGIVIFVFLSIKLHNFALLLVKLLNESESFFVLFVAYFWLWNCCWRLPWLFPRVLFGSDLPSISVPNTSRPSLTKNDWGFCLDAASSLIVVCPVPP